MSRIIDGSLGKEGPDDIGAALYLLIQALDGLGNRYADPGANVRPRFSDLGVCCEHPGQRHWEHEGAGRPIHTMRCELSLVAGRLCNSPGCAESADP